MMSLTYVTLKMGNIQTAPGNCWSTLHVVTMTVCVKMLLYSTRNLSVAGTYGTIPIYYPAHLLIYV